MRNKTIGGAEVYRVGVGKNQYLKVNWHIYILSNVEKKKTSQIERTYWVLSKTNNEVFTSRKKKSVKLRKSSTKFEQLPQIKDIH